MNEIKAIFYRDIENDYLAHILKEIYMDRAYDSFLAGRKDLTILDIGANQGITTSFFSQFATKVYSVEPSSQHIEVLKKMVEFNKLDNVEVIQKALSHVDKRLTFYHSNNNTMFSLSPAVSGDNQVTEEVDGIRMDTLFDQHNIEKVDFLKLDVEGAEVDVVGGEGFEKVADKIGSGLVEYHDWSARNPSQLTTTLMDYGFDVFPVQAHAKLFGFKRG